MSLSFNWDTINNEFVSDFLSSTINRVIACNKDALLGGFAYIDEFSLGDVPPILDFLSVDTMNDDEFKASVRFAYKGQLFIKVHAYAPINPLQSTSRFHKRSRLHMQTAESAAAGYLNVWACVLDLWIDGTAQIHFRKFTDEERQLVTQEAIQNGQSVPKYGCLSIALNSFPLRRANCSTAFDGSVLADKIGNTINDQLTKLQQSLEENNYTHSSLI